jgi:two-component system, OmpR family, KDP operon response regulator KdpE
MNPPLILLIEDDPEMRDIISTTLLAFNPRMPLTAIDNGRDALEELRVHHFDLVFLDNKLPYHSGLKILSLIKPSYNAPFVMVSTSSDRSEVAEAYRLGASLYLCKAPLSRLTEALILTLDLYLNYAVKP